VTAVSLKRGSVLTIGKFDGVHAGHAELLREVIKQARERGLEPAVLTFDRHPACVVAPDRAPRPLMSVEERCERIRLLGVERIFVLPFTQEISRLTPEQFVEQYVHEELQARVVLVGRDFRFGHRQAGNPQVLAELGTRYGFEVRLVEAVRRRGVLVSTSEIRGRVEAGDVSKAARLLERPYGISGSVVAGQGIGSKQTVPTLNLDPSAYREHVLPRDGVYITRTFDVESGRVWHSITNVGVRPTFGGEGRTIETFLLGPMEQAPARIRVEFLRRVREERKFEDAAALKEQIVRDVGRAHAYFRRLARWVPRSLP
jgi:riboflavin kinase / FMN adenylyltransferase